VEKCSIGKGSDYTTTNKTKKKKGRTFCGKDNEKEARGKDSTVYWRNEKQKEMILNNVGRDGINL